MNDTDLWESRKGVTSWGYWFEVTEERIKRYRSIRGSLPGFVKPAVKPVACTSAAPAPTKRPAVVRKTYTYKECEDCEGAGVHGSMTFGYGGAGERFNDCETCGGSGRVCQD